MPTPTADTLASRLRQMRQHSRAQRSMVDGSARELIVVAFAVPVLTMVATVVAVLAVLLFASSGLEGLPPAVSAVWLAIHQVPITISGVTIGVLPLLPTLAVAIGTGRMAASAAAPERSGSELAAVFFSAVGGPLLVTALSLAVVMDGASVLPMQSPPALIAFAYTVGIHAGAALLGILWRRRRWCYERFAITPAIRRGVRNGSIAVCALLTCAALLVLVRLVQRWHVVGDLIATGNDFDGYLGLTALSVLYLPNLVAGTAGILVGADVHVGTASVGLLDVRGGPVPPVPVLGTLPGTGVGTLGVIGFVIPLAIGVVVALRCRDLDPMANVRSVAVAGAFAATVMALLLVISGGQLGEFGDVGITIETAAVFTLGWIVVTGLIVALIHGCLPSTRAARLDVVEDDDDWFVDDEYGYEDDYLTEDDDPYVYDQYEQDDQYDDEDEDGEYEPDGHGDSDLSDTDGEYDDYLDGEYDWEHVESDAGIDEIDDSDTAARKSDRKGVATLLRRGRWGRVHR
ncbi:DUF6350 family protein [Gordonia sp. CPCC 206044]|uniref:cell division protein PerM n=1 Tax=Gordonia sp. CPCC 206044 TaxID=3140793 RepID=UPI003AF3CA10